MTKYVVVFQYEEQKMGGVAQRLGVDGPFDSYEAAEAVEDRYLHDFPGLNHIEILTIEV